MLQYREFLSLTDEEIKFIIKDMFPHTKDVNNIKRDERFNMISCDIYIMEEYPDYADTLNLSLVNIETYDFILTDEELLKWKQFLLAKGCDYRLKDNPYMETENCLKSVINVPEWAEIGKFIEFKMYDKNAGKEKWFREQIISYGNDGFFHRDYDCPVYYNRFSDIGTTVRLCEQKFDYNAACGIDE